jgi:G:T/U-mismatch repair DNA glycosylase
MEAIRQLVLRILARDGKSGIVTTLPPKNVLDFQTMILAEKFMQNGVDPRMFKNVDQAENMLKQIEKADEARASGITETQSAKVFDLQGKEIPPGSKIMGGTQADKEVGMFDNIFNRMQNEMKGLKSVDDLPPPGSRGGKDDIAAPVQSQEETIKNMIEAENKKTINKIKQRQKMLNEAIDNVSPGLSGDRKVDAELVAEDLATRMGKVYDDLPTKERLKLYDEAYQGLTKKKFDPEDLATGGRVGLKVGSGKKFLQKVFGKQGLEDMKDRDPEMFVGLLEVVDMYRKRDKEGLKMYLQKFLPHMDDAQIEDFIRGSDGSEGLIGELIRLGSGRDYKGKIEMIKKSEEMKKLRDLEVTEDMLRKPNADGGRAGYKLGIGPLIEFLAKASKTSPLQFGKNYMKNIREKTLRANETGKFMDLPIAEAGLPAASGALITNQVKKKLKSINEEEKQKNKDEMFKEISQEYKERYKDDPEFLEKMLLSLHENIYMDKKADGGRVGLKAGSLKKFLERRNFLKTIVGNSPEAQNARTLEKLLEEQRELRKALEKKPPVKFPSPGDKEYDDYILRLNQIMAKDRLKSATGGRVGLKGGGSDFMISDAQKEIDAYNQFRDSMNFEQFLKERLFQMEQDKKRLLEKKYGIAVKDGGRIGYKVGGFDKARREFLKMLGLGAGTAAAAKSGILGFSKSPPTKKIIEKVPINSSTTSVPPPYFFELAQKIKMLGKPDKVTYQDRVEIHRYTGKNGDEYELIEDLNTGDMQITKDKTGVGSYGDKSFDTIEDRTVLEYRKGDADVDVETGRGYQSADEYEEYKVEFDPDGTPADATDMDAVVQKEIIAEAKNDAPSIKKAGGGIARMLGE